MSNMHDFANTNYSGSFKTKPVGVYYIWRGRRTKRPGAKFVTSHYYVVRIYGPNRGAITTWCKKDTREEAEQVFREKMPWWSGPVPYYEDIAANRDRKSHKKQPLKITVK